MPLFGTSFYVAQLERWHNSRGLLSLETAKRAQLGGGIIVEVAQLRGFTVVKPLIVANS